MVAPKFISVLDNKINHCSNRVLILVHLMVVSKFISVRIVCTVYTLPLVAVLATFPGIRKVSTLSIGIVWEIQ
jgi:hypothetical protein